MYRVYVVNGEEKIPLLNEFLSLNNPNLKEVAGNSPGYLKFKISPKHPYYGKIYPIQSEIFVYEGDRGHEEEIFRGRSITTEEEFNRTHHVTCESDLAYLCDSIVRPFEFQGSISEFFEKVLEVHNSQVEERKRFRKGIVNVVDNNNYIKRSNSAYSNSLDALREHLVKIHGGYLRTRFADGVRYLDYVTDAGGTNSQVIRYGVNLVNYVKSQDASPLFTALIPTGAKIEVTNPDGTIGSRTVDIASVNGGVDYIYDEEAKSKYGWIFRERNWPDVTDPQNLLSKAREYLERQLYLSDVLKLTAVDLANVDVDISRLKTGYWTKVVSRPHGIDVSYILEERVRYLMESGKDTISLGGTIATLSGSTAKSNADVNAAIKQVASNASKEIDNKVKNATELISGGLGGYIVIGRSEEDGHPEEILIMDAPTKEQAKNLIRLNQNGMGFSNDGYDGTYRNAWTIDGNLVADFVTTGTMLADRIRGGTLELGGTGLGKDGSIIVMDADGTKIGSWDKTGLAILRGILQGVSATFGGVDNQNGALEVLDASGRRIGRWDKDGLDITKGRLRVGPFEVYSDAVSFGDFEVTSDGSNELRSSNGHVRINSNDKPSGSPGGDYATMYIGGDGYEGVNINGGSGYVRCGEFYALNCQLAHGDRLWGLGETIDWMWDEIKSRFDDVWSHINAAGRSGE